MVNMIGGQDPHAPAPGPHQPAATDPRRDDVVHTNDNHSLGGGTDDGDNCSIGEDDADVEVITWNEGANGVVDLTQIEATFEEDVCEDLPVQPLPSQQQGGDTGDVHLKKFLNKRIMECLEYELGSRIKVFEEKWLLNFLEQNGYWIRKEALCKQIPGMLRIAFPFLSLSLFFFLFSFLFFFSFFIIAVINMN
jgi:hypothetical protein